MADIQLMIERVGLGVENGTMKSDTADTLIKVARVAHDLVRSSVLEDENAKLREFIAQHMPEAKAALKAVG